MTEMLLGGVIVVADAWNRFRTPPTSRSLTTYGSYYGALSVYVLLFVFAWVLCVLFPNIVTTGIALLSAYEHSGAGAGSGAAVADAGEGADATPEPIDGTPAGPVADAPARPVTAIVPTATVTPAGNAATPAGHGGESSPELPPALLWAVFVTVALPKLPLVRHWDEHLRAWLQECAAIPYCQRRLVDHMRQGQWQIPLEQQAGLREALEQRGLDPALLIFERPGDERRAPQHDWTQLGVLLMRLEEWEDDPVFDSFARRHVVERKDLEIRMSHLSQRANDAFKLLAAPDNCTCGQRLASTLSGLREAIHGAIKGLLAEAHTLVSRGILNCGRLATTRNAALRHLGFPPQVQHPAVINLDVLAIIAAAALIAISFNLFAVGTSTLQAAQRAAVCIMVMLIYPLAVAAALLPKRWWSFCRRRKGRLPPVGGYLMTVVFAAGGAALVMLIAAGVMWEGGTPTAERLLDNFARRQAPWLCAPALTALGVAVLGDVPAEPGCRRRQRVLEGAIMGLVVWTGSVLALLISVKGWPADGFQWLRLIVSPLVNGALIGGTIGALVPTWYRDARAFRHECRKFERTCVAGPASASPQTKRRTRMDRTIRVRRAEIADSRLGVEG